MHCDMWYNYGDIKKSKREKTNVNLMSQQSDEQLTVDFLGCAYWLNSSRKFKCHSQTLSLQLCIHKCIKCLIDIHITKDRKDVYNKQN